MFAFSVGTLYVAPSIREGAILPCEETESTTSRAKQSAIVIRDLLITRGPDSWLAVFLSGLIFRVASCRFCSKPLYDRFVAPLVTYATRAAPLIICLAAGRGSSLSLTSRPFLIWTLGVGDVLLSSSLPKRSLRVEAVFSTLSLAALCLLATWHDLPVGRLLLQRLALFAIAQAPELAKQTAAAVGASWSQPAGGDAATTAAAAEPQPPKQPVARGAGTGDGGETGDAGAAAASLDVVEACAGSCGCGRYGARGAGGACGELPASHDMCGHSREKGAAVAVGAVGSATVVMTPSDNAEEGPYRQSSSPPSNQCLDCLAEAAPATPAVYQVLHSLPPYRSPIKRRTTRIKIPFAEPDQLGPGYVERLQELAARRGVSLAGVYVRAGCIELLLDAEFVGGGLPYDASPYSSTAGSTANELDEDLWDVAAVVRALGLMEPKSQQLQACGDAAADADVAAAGSYTLDSWTAAPGGKSNHRPYIQLLRPRVLLAPTEAATAAGGRGDVPDGRCGGDNRTVVARLSAVLSYPGGGKDDVVSWGQPQLLVRARGAYLDARLSVRHPPADEIVGGAGAAGAMPHCGARAVCDIELLELPAAPGALLVEVRWGNKPGRSLPVLLLHDAEMAAELAAAEAQVEAQAEAATSRAVGAAGGSVAYDPWHDGVGLDSLLLDLDTWMRCTSDAADADAIATAAIVAQRPSRPSSLGAAAPPLPGHVPSAVDALGAHLLRHATACGWVSIAAHIRADRARFHGTEAAATTTSDVAATAVPASADVAATVTAADAWGCGAGAAVQLPASPPPGSVSASVLTPLSPTPSSSSPSSMSYPPILLLRRSLALAVGWSAAGPAEEAAYQAYAAPLVFAYGHVIQVVEVMSLVALLFRARHQLLSSGNLTSLVGCAVGTLTAAAWPLLPYRRWVALVEGAKIPRYLFYVTAKVMIGFLGFPAPPGIVPYQLGPALLVMEGLLLPGSCLLSPRAALLMALIKWPPSVAMMLGSGATDDPLCACALTLRVVLVAVVTTVAMHTYLRFKYAHWAAATVAARRAQKQLQQKEQ